MAQPDQRRQPRINLDADPFAGLNDDNDDDEGEIARMLKDEEAQQLAHQRARVTFATETVKRLVRDKEEEHKDEEPGQLIPLKKKKKKKKTAPVHQVPHSSAVTVKPEPNKGVKRAPPRPLAQVHAAAQVQAAQSQAQVQAKVEVAIAPPGHIKEQVANMNKSRKVDRAPSSVPLPEPAGEAPAKGHKRKVAAVLVKEDTDQEKKPKAKEKEKEEDATPQVKSVAAVTAPPKEPKTREEHMAVRLSRMTAFPSDDDFEKCGDWVLLALFALKLTGAYGVCPPEKVSNYEAYSNEASFLYFRHLVVRKQVAAAWQHLCDQSGNTDMSEIARMMPHCKLYIEPKPKTMAQDAVCVWSGETTNLHPVALVPIDEICTYAMGAWIKEPGLQAVQFHIGTAFKEVLKVAILDLSFIAVSLTIYLQCVHTLLFALDYIPFQIDASKKKAELLLKGDWCPEMERELEEKVLHSKAGPLFGIRKAVGDMIKANMNAFRAIIGPEIAARFLVPFPGDDGCRIKKAQEIKLRKLAKQQQQQQEEDRPAVE